MKADDIAALASWDPAAETQKEIPFKPARVLLQDFTGVPVRRRPRRDARRRSRASAAIRRRSTRCCRWIWSSITRCRSTTSARPIALDLNSRAGVLAQRGALRVPALGPERVQQLPRGAARHGHRPPGESRVPGARRLPRDHDGVLQAFPDSLVGTDSHTTMVNGLGVVGWGVGGIEAEGAMLGQPISMLIPEVVGVRARRRAARGRDRHRPRADRHRNAAQGGRRRQVRRVLRRRALASLTLADRATLGNMSPEYGATMGFFPVDDETLDYLRSDRAVPTSRSSWSRRYTQGAGPVPHGGSAGARTTRTTIELDLVDHRAEPRRAAAPAGSRRAEAGEAEVRRRPGDRCYGRAGARMPAPDAAESGAGGDVRRRGEASSGAARRRRGRRRG